MVCVVVSKLVSASKEYVPNSIPPSLPSDESLSYTAYKYVPSSKNASATKSLDVPVALQIPLNGTESLSFDDDPPPPHPDNMSINPKNDTLSFFIFTTLFYIL